MTVLSKVRNGSVSKCVGAYGLVGELLGLVGQQQQFEGQVTK